MEPGLTMENDDDLQQQTRRFEAIGLLKPLKYTTITLSCSSDTKVKELQN
jgi:hypothetical protein